MPHNILWHRASYAPFILYNVLNFSTKFCFSLYSLKLCLGVDLLKIDFNGLLLVAHINFIECICISYLWKFLNNRSKCLKQKLRHFIDKDHLEWIKFCLGCIFVNKNFARLAKTLQQARSELAK